VAFGAAVGTPFHGGQAHPSKRDKALSARPKTWLSPLGDGVVNSAHVQVSPARPRTIEQIGLDPAPRV
jgi:hypothetical protein